MELLIKNMVCARCIMSVTETLIKEGIEPLSVALGIVSTKEQLSKEQLLHLNEALKRVGFELVENEEERLTTKVKQIIIEHVRSQQTDERSLSALLSSKLSADFASISRTFAATEGRSIEKYYLQQRIEYVKELIQYGELSMKEIAWKTNFSSVPHLSRQFKQFTGLTPTEYKNCKNCDRTPLDKV